MSRFLAMLLLVVVIVLLVGFARGWFAVSTQDSEDASHVKFTVDKKNVREDAERARESAREIGEKTREEVRALMRETVAVGQGLGVIGEVDVEARIAHAMHVADVQTSMLQDSIAHRPLKLDPIVGAVIELAAGVGVDVPHLRTVYHALRSQMAASP